MPQNPIPTTPSARRNSLGRSSEPSPHRDSSSGPARDHNSPEHRRPQSSIPAPSSASGSPSPLPAPGASVPLGQARPNTQAGHPSAGRNVREDYPSQIYPETQRAAHNRRFTPAEPIAQHGSSSSFFPRLFPWRPSVGGGELASSPSTSSIRLFRQHPQSYAPSNTSLSPTHLDTGNDSNNSNTNNTTAAPTAADARNPSPTRDTSVSPPSIEMAPHLPRNSRLRRPGSLFSANDQNDRRGYAAIDDEATNLTPYSNEDPSSIRRRSSSEPQRPTWALTRPSTDQNGIVPANPNSTGHVITMSDLSHGSETSPARPSPAIDTSQLPQSQPARGRRFTAFDSSVPPRSAAGRLKSTSALHDSHSLREGQSSSWMNFWSAPRPQPGASSSSIKSSEYASDVVNLLDTVGKFFFFKLFCS